MPASLRMAARCGCTSSVTGCAGAMGWPWDGHGMAMEPVAMGNGGNLEDSVGLPFGKLTVCYGKWPFIVELSIKHGDFP